MKLIRLDASSWTTVMDFYEAVLPKLDAPDWHGANLNALVESMVWGGINKVDPPYKIELFHTKGLSRDILDEIQEVAKFTAESRAEFLERNGHDVQVAFEIVS